VQWPLCGALSVSPTPSPVAVRAGGSCPLGFEVCYTRFAD